jgi:DNA-binding CsgD family transcriptional regulator
MDGPAFHLASAELTGLKSSAYLFSLRSGHPSDALASALFNQLLLPTYRWTPRQRKIVRTYRELSRQQAVAKKLRISQQAVSQALRSVDWSAFKESETRLETFLAEALT